MFAGDEAVIAGFVRSPFTPAGRGGLAAIRPDEIAQQVVRALVNRAEVEVEDIEDLILGCSTPEGEQGLNLARLVAFLADLPVSTAAVTVNRFCGSSMQAIHMAVGAIHAGAGECFVCAGVESMSRIPISGFCMSPHPRLAESYPQAYMAMGVTAENVAREFRIGREAQEHLAFWSHQKALAARIEGRLAAEIATIREGDRIVTDDGCIRPDTSLEALAALPPIFEAGGSVTAGTSSPLSDGAAAVLVCSRRYARTRGLEEMARVVSMAVSGCPPELMGIGPVAATRKALARAGLRLADVEVVEINEAFSAQVLAVMQELDMEEVRVNIDGGALALGHPLGASGARLVGKAASLLARGEGRFALATMCIGGGQGIATVLEKA